MSVGHDLIDTADVRDLLAELGIEPSPTAVDVTALDGGVSSGVFVASSVHGAVVVKQALPELKTAATWRSDVERFRIEVAAADALAELIPGAVPSVLAVDPTRHLFVMEAVANTGTWKAELLGGHVDVSLAAQGGDA